MQIRKITVPFSKSQIANLTNKDWRGVQKLIEKPNCIMIYEHQKQAKALIALGACLNASGFGIMRMHVYHNCQEDPVLLQQFGNGFAVGKCPMCEIDFYEDEVQYELELIVKYNIKLEN